MIKTSTEILLFKLFTKHNIDNDVLFNSLCEEIENEKKKVLGNTDAEHYETFIRLINLENNAGWETREKHGQRIDIINEAMYSISDRSEEWLP